MSPKRYFRTKPEAKVRFHGFFEFDERGFPVRQIEIHDHIVLLLKRPEELIDFKARGVAREAWAEEIDQETFEQAWDYYSQRPHGTSPMDDPEWRKLKEELAKIPEIQLPKVDPEQLRRKREEKAARLRIEVAKTMPLGKQNWAYLDTPLSPTGRGGHAMAMGGDGRIYLFGGETNDTWVLDPWTKTWTELNPTIRPSPRFDHTMARGGDGNIYLFGGRKSGDWLDETWVLLVPSGEWRRLEPPNRPSARERHAMATGGDGRIYLFGGLYEDFTYRLGDTWVFDPWRVDWTLLNPQNRPPGRHTHAMAQGGDGNVYMYGGFGEGLLGRLSDTWVFTLQEGDWRRLSPRRNPPDRVDHTMVTGGDGRLYLFGGVRYSNDTWVFDLDRGTWDKLKPRKLPPPVDGARMAAGGDGRIYLFGGDYDDFGWPDFTWVFDPFL